MFEKESKEYAIGLTYPKFEDSQIANMVLRDVEGAFQKGAEVGYNKANEWHYVKDGNLPKENQLVLLYRENSNGANIALTYWFQSYVKDKVIAWKEIVLPKEIE